MVGFGRFVMFDTGGAGRSREVPGFSVRSGQRAIRRRLVGSSGLWLRVPHIAGFLLQGKDQTSWQNRWAETGHSPR